MARELKFQIKELEGLHYLCSENKGADQLRRYCAFFVMHMQQAGFLMTWLNSCSESVNSVNSEYFVFS